MSKNKSNKNKNKSHESLVEIIRITDAGKTRRTCVICAAIVLSIGIIVFGVYISLDRPWWQVILATLIGLGVPSFVLWRITLKFKEHISETGDRTRELEMKVDPERSSSGLNTRGETMDGL